QVPARTPTRARSRPVMPTRGAPAAQRDAGRLDYTFTAMSEDEAKQFGIAASRRPMPLVCISSLPEWGNFIRAISGATRFARKMKNALANSFGRANARMNLRSWAFSGHSPIERAIMRRLTLVVAVLCCAAIGAAVAYGLKARFDENKRCCLVPTARNISLSLR